MGTEKGKKLMEEKKYVFRQIYNIYIQGERLTELIRSFQSYVDKYGSSIRLEYRHNNHGYDDLEFYLEYKELETDEEYQQRIASKEVALKATEIKEKKLLKELLQKYMDHHVPEL